MTDKVVYGPSLGSKTKYVYTFRGKLLCWDCATNTCMALIVVDAENSTRTALLKNDLTVKLPYICEICSKVFHGK